LLAKVLLVHAAYCDGAINPESSGSETPKPKSENNPHEHIVSKSCSIALSRVKPSHLKLDAVRLVRARKNALRDVLKDIRFDPEDVGGEGRGLRS
jgi:hypothetical protein